MSRGPTRYVNLRPTVDAQTVSAVVVQQTGGAGPAPVIEVRRRMLPDKSLVALVRTVVVVAGDRLDLIASRELGDPLLADRILDENEAMNPWDLLVPGTVLRIPMQMEPETEEGEEVA